MSIFLAVVNGLFALLFAWRTLATADEESAGVGMVGTVFTFLSAYTAYFLFTL